MTHMAMHLYKKKKKHITYILYVYTGSRIGPTIFLLEPPNLSRQYRHTCNLYVYPTTTCLFYLMSSYPSNPRLAIISAV